MEENEKDTHSIKNIVKKKVKKWGSLKKSQKSLKKKGEC